MILTSIQLIVNRKKQVLLLVILKVLVSIFCHKNKNCCCEFSVIFLPSSLPVKVFSPLPLFMYIHDLWTGHAVNPFTLSMCPNPQDCQTTGGSIRRISQGLSKDREYAIMCKTLRCYREQHPCAEMYYRALPMCRKSQFCSAGLLRVRDVSLSGDSAV